ncbi:MAG: enoyl-CoA hydratase-related protein [Myxococcota bacterium]
MSDLDIDSEVISVVRENGVVLITLNRPNVNNALAPQHFALLGKILEEIAQTASDRVVVITGAGGGFCAGADLASSGGGAERLGQGPIAREQWVRELTAPAVALHRLPKPTIAAVNGVAAGGGCNLALGCDIVFAGERARFTEVFVNRALSLDYGGSWLLPKLIGLQRAKDLAFRGDVIDAKKALELGLVLDIIPNETLLSHALEYARMLAAKPPIALSLIKTGMNRLANASFEEAIEWEATAQSTCLGSEDFREAMRAWATKSEGNYSGK